MTRMEKFTEWWNRIKIIMGDPQLRAKMLKNQEESTGSGEVGWYGLFAGANPMTLHMSMFAKSIRDLGS